MIEKNVHFAKTIREYKNVVKKNLKIVKHVNAIIFQNQSQSQSQSQKSTFSISSKNDKNEKRQCVCKVMHIEEIVNTLLNLSNHRIENAINKKKMNKKCDFEITIIFLYILKNY
jgi:hypothetical protein